MSAPLGCRVLVVDDEPSIRRSLAALLGRRGYSVQVAEHGAAALSVIDHSGTPDVALVDLTMPVMNGAEFLREVRARGYVFPSIIVSGAPEVAIIAEQVGASGWTAKPYVLDELVVRINHALART